MIAITAKDVILLLLGAIVALPVTAGWESTRNWLSRRGRRASEFERAWQVRLKSEDPVEQRKAVQEINARAFNDFILGNIMFAAASLGAAAVTAFAVFGEGLEYAELYVAAAFSFAALVYFSASMRWLRRLLRALK